MLKEYDEYRLTPEAIWYDRVPVKWNSTKMRTMFTERVTKVSDKEYPALSVGKMGVVPQLETAVKTDNGDNRKLICEGDFAINSRSDRKGSSGISDYTGSASLIITVLQPFEELNRRYYHYLLRSNGFVEEFYRNGHGLVSDLWTTKWQEMKNIFIPVPPKEEQDQIVYYLDWKVSEMNHFIREKKKQIKKLEELKKKYVDDIITNGISDRVTKHISKAEWMGEVPVHWNEYRLKNIFTEINERSELGLEPHLSMSQKKGLVTDDEDIERRLLSESYAGAKLCNKDDLVLNRLKAHLGVFALAPMQGVVSPDYTVLRLNTKIVIPKYLEYLLKSNACRKELVTRVRGIVEGFWRLYTEDLGVIPVCIPDLKEQRRILNKISAYDEKIKILIDSLQQEILLIEELKIKTIADVVTGQVDVRNVIIPEYTTDDDTDDDFDSNDIDDDSEESDIDEE